MKRLGEILFAAVFVVALALYGLTAPDGLPWNSSTHLALAYLGEIMRLPQMPHPIWGFHVQTLGGAVALSVFMAALAAGLLAALVNRYLGWKTAVFAVSLWIFMPGVWNRAITGERGICLASMVVVALWVLNVVMLRVTRKARAMRKVSGADGVRALPGAGEATKRGKVARSVSWVVLGVAGLFAVVSLTLHDYKLGEAASVYARGVVEAAGEREIVLNGVCDGQIVREVKRRNEKGKSADVHSSTSTSHFDSLHAIALRNDDAYRTNLLSWVRSAFPTETNLWVSAQVSPTAFVEAAVRKHPDRFYLMTGASATREQWEKRWEDFGPYLGSSDPFVPVARRLFGFEGNAVGNAMLDEVKRLGEGERRTAYSLYKRIYTEVDPGNFSALLNMSEMIRLGYAASGEEKKWVQEKQETFFKDPNNRKYFREIARSSGPVRADPKLLEQMAEESKRQLAAKIAAGEKIELKPVVLSLIDWNNEMVSLMQKGELEKAGRIARTILSNPKWQDFIPANAVMGFVASKDRDYVASAAFYATATDTTNEVPVSVLNGYADSLMHIGRLDEAEKMARRAVRESDEKYWLARLTLAEVLEEREKVTARGDGEEGKIDEEALAAFAVGGKVKKRVGGESRRRTESAEIGFLLKSVLKNSPEELHEQIRKMHKDYLR